MCEPGFSMLIKDFNNRLLCGARALKLNSVCCLFFLISLHSVRTIYSPLCLLLFIHPQYQVDPSKCLSACTKKGGKN